ncbi:FHA domain-containing protein [Nocardioides sp. YIM 152588]|uniref:FHA domain-containing protein n=1 Tax=Nocardioides sp. YIM 152588 TaxID=3158259 RepID=UPI0032E467CE
MLERSPPPSGPPPGAPPSGLPTTMPPPYPPPAPGGPARLQVSDGQSVVVDRVVLIGRAPEARRFGGTEQPRLVTVPSRLNEISSTHVEVRPGATPGAATVTDMGSTNGTVIVRPGESPEDLKPGIAVPVVPGTIINLGDGITIEVGQA